MLDGGAELRLGRVVEHEDEGRDFAGLGLGLDDGRDADFLVGEDTRDLGEDAVREDYRQEFGISRFGKVEDLGSLIAFLSSTHGRWLHGATIDIDGGEVRST